MDELSCPTITKEIFWYGLTEFEALGTKIWQYFRLRELKIKKKMQNGYLEEWKNVSNGGLMELEKRCEEGF